MVREPNLYGLALWNKAGVTAHEHHSPPRVHKTLRAIRDTFAKFSLQRIVHMHTVYFSEQLMLTDCSTQNSYTTELTRQHRDAGELP